MEHPFDTRIRQSFSTLEKTRQNFIFNFGQMDKILVWIVGFCITGIGLIVSKITTLTDLYSQWLLESILILLSISVVSGIIYRITALFFLTTYQKIMFFLEGAFSKEKSIPTKTRELKDPVDILELVQNIKTDFGLDYFNVVDSYNKAENPDSKLWYINYLKSEYSKLASWSAVQYVEASIYVGSVLKKAFGYSDKQLDNLGKEKNDSAYLKLWGTICLVAISICLVAFLTVIILLVLNYK